MPVDRASRLLLFVREWRRLRPLVPARTAKPVRASLEKTRRFIEDLRSAIKARRRSPPPLDVWRIAGLDRQERRFGEVLAWLLSPSADHDLGAVPLAGLYEALRRSDPSCVAPDDCSRASVRAEVRPLGSARDRVDLVIDHQDLVLFLEMKLDAAEGPDQLARYVEAAQAMALTLGRNRWCVAYLTRSSSRVREPGVVPLTWSDLASSIRHQLTMKRRDPVPQPVLQLLQKFEEI